MKSPFPRMDPYIEDRGLFEDFHGKLISEIERYLSDAVSERYVVRTAERPYVVIAEPNGKVNDYRENFIEIYLTEPERLLVTCIEVLSPSNKRPGTEGWDIYLRKRQGLLLGGANLIEIDLLRGGTKFPMMDTWPISPYCLLVSRRGSPGNCRVWPAHFRKPLPTIPVPLVAPDGDVLLDL